MAIPLLQTKLYVPPIRSQLVQRPRLIERLSESVHSGCRLILVSAPAGFGKTTLLANWIRQTGRSAAWLSLDEDDNDPVRFWSHAIAALQTVRAGTGQAGLDALASPQPPQLQSVLVGLINEIAGTDVEWVLVLDDWHLITEPEINDSLVFLLDHFPPQMHLILATRADPPWPLARLRTRGEMVELRTQDLRFTPDETSDFLNRVMGLSLSIQDVATLDMRIEGWIAGLQLAALSMAGREDAARFVQTFSGSHRFVLDYLVEEVLARQPDDIQEFLLQTSILQRLTASLCDAVLDAEGMDSQAVLLGLERANLFLVPLDDERRWYRYHHLFGDLLLSRLLQRHPDLAPILHRRASEWYAARDMIAQAIRHALQANDMDRTEELVRHNALAMILHGELRTLRGALEKLPDQALRSRPWLSIGYAWALAYADRSDAVEALLADVEGMLEKHPRGEAVEQRHIAGQVAAIRSYLSMGTGDLTRGNDLARKALELLPEDDPAMRAFAASLLAISLDRLGDHTAAIPVLEEVIVASRAAGDLPTAIFAQSRLVGTLSVLGQLSRLMAVCQEAMALNDEYARQSGRRSPAAGQLYLFAGGAMYYRNDLAAAERYIRESIDLCTQSGQPQGIASGYLSLSRILQAAGDQDAALEAMQRSLQDGERVSRWFASFGHAWEALLSLLRGDLGAAVAWAQASDLRFDDEVSLHTYVKQIILARVLLAQGSRSRQRLEEALLLSDRLVDLAASTEANRYLIESLVVRSLALWEQGRPAEALADLGRALAIAEPEGFVRIFIDEGAPMEALLRSALSQGIATDYISKLLVEMGSECPAPVRSRASPVPLLADPLSERELEVLRLLPTHLSSTEIAQELYVSKNTIRSHVSHIYDKLGVHNRTDAVQRAQELGLL